MPFKGVFISFGFFLLFIVMWLTAPPVRKSPPSCNWFSLLFKKKKKNSYYILKRTVYIYLYTYILTKYSHNECSELKWISQNVQNQNSHLHKRRHRRFILNRLLLLFVFCFFFYVSLLRCLHWKCSRFLTRACDRSLQYCKCLRIEPTRWAAIFVSRKMAQT